MIDLKELLSNNEAQKVLGDIGVEPGKIGEVMGEAVTTIKDGFSENPDRLVSLLSDKENSKEDQDFSSILQGNLVKNLVSKIGLSEGIASKAKSIIPILLSVFTKKLSESGENDKSGISGLMDTISNSSDLLGSLGKKKGIGGMLSGMFGK